MDEGQIIIGAKRLATLVLMIDELSLPTAVAFAKEVMELIRTGACEAVLDASGDNPRWKYHFKSVSTSLAAVDCMGVSIAFEYLAKRWPPKPDATSDEVSRGCYRTFEVLDEIVKAARKERDTVNG